MIYFEVEGNVGVGEVVDVVVYFEVEENVGVGEVADVEV